MTLAKLIGVSTAGLMVMATAAMAASQAVPPVSSGGSVLIAKQCPPGWTFVRGRTSHGRWIDAHCIDTKPYSTHPPREPARRIN